MGNPEDPDVIRSRQIDADNAWAKAHIEKAENWLDDQADRQRALIPPNDHVGLLMHDGTLGIVKTAYHLAKGLLGLAMDVGRLKDDPVYRENVAQKVWNGAVWLAKEAWISQGHEGPLAIQDQNERVIAFSKGLWDKAKKGWEEAGTKPGHQTQLVVEIAANIALFFVGGEAATASRAEKLEEGAAILEEVTQPCKTAVMSNKEILAEQAAREAAEAERAAEAGRVAGQPAVPAEVKAAEEAAKAARNNPDTIALGLSTYKEPVTLPNGQVIEAAHDGVLQRFAGDVKTGTGEKAATWTKFEPTVDPESGLTDWGPTIKNAMNDAKEIHFNLEGMSNKAEIAANPDITRFKPPSTNWELSTILSDPELLKKTTFYDGAGNVVKFP